MIARRSSTLADRPPSPLNTGRLDAIAVLDVFDIAAAIEQACDPPCDPVMLDLAVLRNFILEHSAHASFVCLASQPQTATDHRFPEHAVSEAGWRWATPGPRLWDGDVRPAVGYTCALLECLRFEHGRHTPPVVLVSHDPAWVGSVRRYLEAGGRVLGIGLVELFDDRLIELTDHQGLQLLDLEFDAGAVALPGRRMFKACEGDAGDLNGSVVSSQ